MPKAAPLSSSISNQRLALLFMVNLVTAAGNTALQSILPAIGTQLGVADVWVSLAFSWSALLWVFTAPRWARQSDKRGRKALMALGLMGFTASMLLSGLVLWSGLVGLTSAATTFALFALFRTLYGGFGSAAPPAVQAYIAARSEPAERTRLLSIIASSFGLGTIIGPTMAPWFIVPPFGLAAPSFAFAAVGIVVAVALRLMLPDDTPRFAARGAITSYPAPGVQGSLPDDSGGEEDDSAAPHAPAERIGWLDRRVRNWSIAGLLGGHAQAMVLGVIGFLVLDRLHLRATPELAAAPTGHVLWVGAMATLLAQWGLIPLLSLSPRACVVAGGVVAGAGTLMLGGAHDITSISTAVGIAMLGFGLFRPGFTTGASLSVARHLQGQVAGQTASVNGATYIAAPAIGVLLYNWASGWALFALGVVQLGLAVLAWHALKGAPHVEETR